MSEDNALGATWVCEPPTQPSGKVWVTALSEDGKGQPLFRTDEALGRRVVDDHNKGLLPGSLGTDGLVDVPSIQEDCKEHQDNRLIFESITTVDWRFIWALIWHRTLKYRTRVCIDSSLRPIHSRSQVAILSYCWVMKEADPSR